MYLSHGQPLVRAHCIMSKCPRNAALEQVLESHGHSLARAHCTISKWPHNAALEQVSAFQGHPYFRTHRSIYKSPFNAALEHRMACHGNSLTRAQIILDKSLRNTAFEHTSSDNFHPLCTYHFNTRLFLYFTASAHISIFVFSFAHFKTTKRLSALALTNTISHSQTNARV